MTETARRRANRSGWWALAISVVARSTLGVLVSMLGWSLAPSLLGWHTTVVMTGSMLPNLVPGDVVVSRAIDPAKVQIGQVLLVDNPDHAGELRMHRLVRIDTNGELILRGDANRTPDSTPVRRSAVRGVGALHIPKIGLPFLWAANGQYGPLLATAMALALLLRLAFWWRPDGATDAVDPENIDDESAPTTPADEPEAAPVDLAQAIAPRRPLIAGLVRRTLLVGFTAAVVVAVSAGSADAMFSGRSADPTDTFAANEYFSCANADKADAAVFALPLNETKGTTAADVSGNSHAGTYASSGVTYSASGPCPRDSAKAVTLNGSTGDVSEATVPSGSAQSYEIWFKAPSTSHGGGLMSVTNSSGKQTKMALAMTSAGKIVFAVGSSTSTVTTTAAYNNNVWHLAVGTITGTAINLYVDNQSAVTMVSGANGTSTKCFMGWDSHADLGTGTSDYFTGSIAYAAAYNAALSATQVTNHYVAGT